MSSSSKQESFYYNFLFWFLIIQSMFFCLHSLQESSSLSSKNDPKGGGRRIIKCIESEREALLNFKAGLTDPTNILSSWEGHQDDCCKWWGVSCNKNTTHVIGLNLRGTFDEYGGTYVRYLAGEITPSLLHLKHLRHLDLSFNYFSGTSIPRFIGSFRKLTYLNLSSANFGGLVPPQLGNLSRLRYLDLNDPYGSFNMHVDNLRWLPRLSSLKYLDISCVDLSSVVDWFQIVKMLPSLTTLNLRFCLLPSIPTSSLSYINFSTSLNTLDLSGNLFNSSLPQWIWNISSLTNLDLSDNSFYGPIPDAVGSLIYLEVLQLGGNNLDGIIPNLCRLTLLDLYNNNLRGDIGGLVESVWNCTHPMLQTLGLSYNQLSGKLTSGIQHMRSLNSLDLSYNQLHGPIPVEIGKLSQLSYIHLSNNQLHGPIPVEIGMLSQLSEIHLSNNQLHGPIPVEIGKLSQLSYIDLSNNQLHGPIPVEIGKLSQLSRIDLSNNQLHGPIPVEIGNPIYFSLFVQSIDLSDNYLTGEIPEEIGALIGLVNLNLASNRLIGNIPGHIGRMQSLKSLDLSRNELSGNIPLSISDLNFLSYLNLSYNHLSGKIPSGNQIQTLLDPSIYAGNIGLCGPPLPTNCSSSRSDTEKTGEYVKDDEERVWLYCSIVMGYIVGFWAVCGVLLFNKTWRRAYFQFFDNSYDWFYVEVSLALTKLKRARVGRN